MKRAHIVLGTTILALGILPVVPAIHAREAAEADTSEAINQAFAVDAGVPLRVPFGPSNNLSLGAVTQSSTGEGEESVSELNRKLTRVCCSSDGEDDANSSVFHAHGGVIG